MTDFLEEAVGKETNALLEAERRLAAALAGRPGGEGADSPGESRARGPEGGWTGAAAGGEGQRWGEPPAAGAFLKESGRENHPLKEALAKVEWSAAAWGAGPVEGRVDWTDGRRRVSEDGAEAPRRPYGRPDRREEMGPAADQIRWPPAGPYAAAAAQEWAEQVDRAFQRDSRRYDAGFFLF